MKKENKAFYKMDGNGYKVEKSKDGKKYVALDSVRTDTCNFSDGNTKTGKNVTCYNLPMFYTCDHNCECYKLGKCYANGGCYNFADNQATYSENLAFLRTHSKEEIIETFIKEIENKGNALARYFTVGDIPNIDFLDIVNTVAKHFDGQVKFWMYTKKYGLVNLYCDKYGLDYIANNLTIIFSHWLNEDGTYFPMYNPYDFPTSEFIPVGKEELAKTVTHVCPCSDPDVVTDCEHCEHACYNLKHGESMALLEHSTKESKERDAIVRESHERIKKTLI